MAAFTANTVTTSTAVAAVTGLPAGTYTLALTAGTTPATLSNSPLVTTSTGYVLPAGSTIYLTVRQMSPPTLYVISTGAGTLSWMTGS